MRGSEAGAIFVYLDLGTTMALKKPHSDSYRTKNCDGDKRQLNESTGWITHGDFIRILQVAIGTYFSGVIAVELHF